MKLTTQTLHSPAAAVTISTFAKSGLTRSDIQLELHRLIVRLGTIEAQALLSWIGRRAARMELDGE